MPENKGAIYISVESYFVDMIPEACFKNGQSPYPYVDIFIFHNNVLVDKYIQKPEFQPFWYTAQQGRYKSGDSFTIKVQYNWNSQAVARDYSVVVYSQQNIEIVDEYYESNMLHYDGQTPSGF